MAAPFGRTKPQGWRQVWAARGCSAASPQAAGDGWRTGGCVGEGDPPDPAHTVRCHRLHPPAPPLPSQRSDGLTDVPRVHHQPLGHPALCLHPDLVRQVEAEVFPAEVAGVGAGGDVVFALFHFWGSPAPQGGGEDAGSPLPQHALGPLDAPNFPKPQRVQGERPRGGGAALLPSMKPPPQPLLFAGGKNNSANASPSPVTGRG